MSLEKSQTLVPYFNFCSRMEGMLSVTMFDCPEGEKDEAIGKGRSSKV